MSHQDDGAPFRYGFLHGEAIAIGMVGEAYLSHLVGDLTEEDFKSVKSSIKTLGLPTDLGLRRYSYQEINTLLEKDKKNIGKEISWTLLESLGNGVVDQVVDNELIRKMIDVITVK